MQDSWRAENGVLTVDRAKAGGKGGGLGTGITGKKEWRDGVEGRWGEGLWVQNWGMSSVATRLVSPTQFVTQDVTVRRCIVVYFSRL